MHVWMHFDACVQYAYCKRKENFIKNLSSRKKSLDQFDQFISIAEQTYGLSYLVMVFLNVFKFCIYR